MMMRNYLIYAVDFDGTLCNSVYPMIGEPNLKLINDLIQERKKGNKVVLWTCREHLHLEQAVAWCKQFGLEFDGVNENLPELIALYGNDCRKIGADIYLDDKAQTICCTHLKQKEA